jgi:hypothetical protein
VTVAAAAGVHSAPSKEGLSVINRIRGWFGVGVLVAAVVLAIAGCKPKAQEEVKEAVEEAGEAAAAVAEEAVDATQNAAEAVEGAVENAAETVEEAVEGEDDGGGN